MASLFRQVDDLLLDYDGRKGASLERWAYQAWQVLTLVKESMLKPIEIHFERGVHHAYVDELELVTSEDEEPGDFEAYNEDIEALVEAFADAGYRATRVQVYNLWSLYSADNCAGWLLGANCPDAVKLLRPFFREVRQ